jgi:hypothetical protein
MEVTAADIRDAVEAAKNVGGETGLARKAFVYSATKKPKPEEVTA